LRHFHLYTYGGVLSSGHHLGDNAPPIVSAITRDVFQDDASRLESRVNAEAWVSV